jgi:hypothetical protein
LRARPDLDIREELGSGLDGVFGDCWGGGDWEDVDGSEVEGSDFDNGPGDCWGGGDRGTVVRVNGSETGVGRTMGGGVRLTALAAILADAMPLFKSLER